MDFTFKGLTATSFGIIVNSMPTFKKPKRKVNKKSVDGRHGTQVEELGYDSYSLPSLITPTDTAYFDAIYAWLDGPGVLICGDDPLKYRIAEVIEEVEYGRLAIWKEASIDFFIADPFRYVLNEADLIFTTVSFPATITNTGTFESLPLLKLTGSGAISITLNGTTFTYTFPSGETYVWIDCKEQAAYYGTTVDYRDGSMSGNYPVLKVGSNALAKTGTVTQAIVSKRTCFL